MTVALTVGLTGGIASGKSTVAAGFIALGVPLLEADDVARAIVAPGEPVLAAIASRFGDELLQADGTLDRRRLRERVFADPAARRDLEALTHPAIRARVLDWRRRQTAPYCIYAAALLLESGQAAAVDRVLLVDAPESVQARRLVARDAVDPDLARRMIAAQASRAVRLGHADDLLDNADSDLRLTPQLQRLHRFYTRLAAD